MEGYLLEKCKAVLYWGVMDEEKEASITVKKASKLSKEPLCFQKITTFEETTF